MDMVWYFIFIPPYDSNIFISKKDSDFNLLSTWKISFFVSFCFLFLILLLCRAFFVLSKYITIFTDAGFFWELTVALYF